MSTERHRRILVIAGVVGFVILVGVVLVLAILNGNKQQAKVVRVAGLTECAQEISADMRVVVEQGVYDYVRAANEHNGVELMESYDGVVRAGSCENVVPESDSTGQAKMIVDIELAGQSWWVEFYYLAEGAQWIDLGPVELLCVAEKERIYGDFGCATIPRMIVSESDALMDVLPYFDEQESGGVRFTIWARPEDEFKINHIEISLNTCVVSVAENYKRAALAKLAELRKEVGDEKEYRVVYTDLCS